MKAILITIKSQHLCNTLNGKKTLEIRKNKALCNAIKKLIEKYGKATIYVVCSKSGENLTKLVHIGYEILNNFELKNAKKAGDVLDVLNGKVVCKFECDKVHDIEVEENDSNGNYSDTYIYCDIQDLEDQSCLDFDDIVEYLWSYDKWGGKGYAIPIQRLKIFEEPKRIYELIKYNKNAIVVDNCLIGFGNGSLERLTTAPQNFCYIEV